MGPIEELIAAAGAVVDEALQTDDAEATQRMHWLRVARQRAHHDQFRTEHELMNRRGQLLSLYGQRIDVLWGALEEVSALCARWTKQADARENPISSLLIMSMVSEAVAVLNKVEGDNRCWDVRDALGGPPVVRDRTEGLADLQRELLELESTDPVVGAALRVAASYVQRIQQLETANAELTEQLAASEADRVAMTYTVKPCVRCKELESECDLLIWENEQSARALWSHQNGVTIGSVTDAQRAELLRQLNGAPSIILAEDHNALLTDLRKRNLQALDALHAERREKKLAADELDRVMVIVGKLRTNHAWVGGVLDALAHGNRMDAAPLIQGSRGQVDMLSNQQLLAGRARLECTCGHPPASHTGIAGVCADCTACTGYEP